MCLGACQEKWPGRACAWPLLGLQVGRCAARLAVATAVDISTVCHPAASFDKDGVATKRAAGSSTDRLDPHFKETCAEAIRGMTDRNWVARRPVAVDGNGWAKRLGVSEGGARWLRVLWFSKKAGPGRSGPDLACGWSDRARPVQSWPAWKTYDVWATWSRAARCRTPPWLALRADASPATSNGVIRRRGEVR